MDTSATARKADLRAPETDARPVTGHDPDCVPMVPPLDERQPEDLYVEANRLLEVDDLEDELIDASDGNPLGHAIRSSGAYSSMRRRSTPSPAKRTVTTPSLSIRVTTPSPSVECRTESPVESSGNERRGVTVGEP